MQVTHNLGKSTAKSLGKVWEFYGVCIMLSQ